jgi:hypothetical protein
LPRGLPSWPASLASASLQASSSEHSRGDAPYGDNFAGFGPIGASESYNWCLEVFLILLEYSHRDRSDGVSLMSKSGRENLNYRSL